MIISGGGRQAGKSIAAAARIAKHLKEGKRCFAASLSKSSNALGLDEIVCVPGFDDGKQILDHNRSRRTCDDNLVAQPPTTTD